MKTPPAVIRCRSRRHRPRSRCSPGRRTKSPPLARRWAITFRQTARPRSADRSGQPSGCRDRHGPGFDYRQRPRSYRIAGALRLVRVTVRRFTRRVCLGQQPSRVPVILTRTATSARALGRGEGVAAPPARPGGRAAQGGLELRPLLHRALPGFVAHRLVHRHLRPRRYLGVGSRG
jgi:hypothetical protein